MEARVIHYDLKHWKGHKHLPKFGNKQDFHDW